MKKLIFSIIILFSVGTAYAAEAPPTGVVQAFTCSLNHGYSMLDVREALRDLAAGAEASDNPDPRFGLFVWLPLRGNVQSDFLFGVINSDLRSMAAGTSQFVKSPEGQDMTRRLQGIADCASGVMLSEQVADGNIGMTADMEPDAIIETFRCDIRNGSDMDDVRSAISYWKTQFEAIESKTLDDYDAYVWYPIRGGLGNDFYWVGNSPNLEAWGNGLQDYMDSEQGKKAQARIDAHSKCESAIWTGYWMVVPKEF